MAVSKRLRYEILRRDNHACRYCGATAPDVALTVDHVIPTALGGSDDPSNLVTACRDCNAGKSASTPDAPIVEDVKSDAFRWARAMALVAEDATQQFYEAQEEENEFLTAWNRWTYPQGQVRVTVPIAEGWRQSYAAFRAAGMPAELLEEQCIPIAMNSRAPIDDKWRYFCGVAWRKVEQLREDAAACAEFLSSAPMTGSRWDS